MKKYIYMMMIACSAIFASCTLNDPTHGRGEGSSENVDLSNLGATGRIGQVVLTWDNPTNPDYYYSMVSYEKNGETVRQKVSVYSEDAQKGSGHTYAKILGFTDTKTYEFTVVPYTSYGVAGKPQTISAAPEDAAYAYKYIPETVTVEGAVEGATIKWVNEYEIPVTINISYKNILGETVVKKVASSEDGEVTIGAFVNPTEVTVTATNKAGTATSDAVKVTATPLKGEIPYKNYSIVDFTGGILGGGMEMTKVIDGVWSSTWHSSTSASGPCYFIVDLSAVYQVGSIELVRRSDDPGAIGYPETIKIETSQDNASYKTIGTYEFDASYIFNHVYTFDPVNARYIKITITHSGSWTHLAEFVAYSHADATKRYADQSAAELVPDPDDDDTYYPETDYLRPMLPSDSWYNAGWYNHVTCTQSNPENDPSEWTYETTGGDSWVPLAPLTQDAGGPMLVFHCKSTNNLMCEFFWCKGGFPNGLAGGRETAFNVKKSDTWKTTKVDMENAWKSHGWPGKKGDGVRFDIGDGAGETVVVRLMRWQAK